MTVKQSTIQNRFRKSGFRIPTELSGEPDISAETPDDEISTVTNMEAFVDMDDEIPVCESQADDLTRSH